MQRLPQTAAVIAVLLALPSVGVAQMQRMEVPKLVPLRLLITMDGDVEKASYVTVELMDPVGSSSATDRKMTDGDGRVAFQALTGLHRVRITGPNIQPYEGEFEIARNEVSHVERIRVRPAQNAQQPGGTAPAGGLVPALRLRVPDRAQKAFEKAAEAMRRERWQESRSLFETAVREYPQYDLAYNGLGMVQMQMNELGSAREAFSKAIELNRDFSAAYRNLARISFAEHKYEEADALLTKSLEGDPLNVWALSSAANAELLTRKYPEAIAHARKAHSVPHEGLAGVHVVAALALEASQQPHEAIQEYQLYLDEDPKGRDVDRAQKAIVRLSVKQ